MNVERTECRWSGQVLGQINILISGRKEKAMNEIEGKPREYGISKPSGVFPEVGVSNPVKCYRHIQLNEKWDLTTGFHGMQRKYLGELGIGTLSSIWGMNLYNH